MTIVGHLTATNGAQPLAGITASLGPTTTATTDDSGRFALTVSPFAAIRVTLQGASIVPRSALVGASASRDVSLDAIALGGRFDMEFYQKFVRNTFDEPTKVQPLRRWTHAPLVYVRTVDEAGKAIDAVTLRTVIDAVWSVGSMWTGGAFGIQDVPSGTGDQTGQAGWITVKWADLTARNACGQADVALEGGVITLSRETSGCACNGSKMRPRTVRHELGHAFGFWHTGDASDLMSGLPVSACDTPPSARELYHAAIAYRRPVGNTAPDDDPAGAVNFMPRRTVE